MTKTLEQQIRDLAPKEEFEEHYYNLMMDGATRINNKTITLKSLLEKEEEMVKEITEETLSPGQLFKKKVLDPEGMTIQAAADIMGMPRRRLSDWVNGKTSTSKIMADQVLEHFFYDVQFSAPVLPKIKSAYERLCDVCDPEKQNFISQYACGVDPDFIPEEIEEHNYFITYIIESKGGLIKMGNDCISFPHKIECEEDIRDIEQYVLESVEGDRSYCKVILQNFKEL